MIRVEEMAEGIVQIDCRGTLDSACWETLEHTLHTWLAERHAPLYVLLNLSAMTTLNPMTYGELITAEVFNRTALTVLVARRAHIHLAREIVSTYPDRDRIQLRVLPRLDEAFRALLDRQTMDRMRGARQFGH
ncbi:MAG: hypothetical protein AAFV33_04360 [Chloroflexota bacterium]